MKRKKISFIFPSPRVAGDDQLKTIDCQIVEGRVDYSELSVDSRGSKLVINVGGQYYYCQLNGQVPQVSVGQKVVLNVCSQSIVSIEFFNYCGSVIFRYLNLDAGPKGAAFTMREYD